MLMPLLEQFRVPLEGLSLCRHDKRYNFASYLAIWPCAFEVWSVLSQVVRPGALSLLAAVATAEASGCTYETSHATRRVKKYGAFQDGCLFGPRKTQLEAAVRLGRRLEVCRGDRENLGCHFQTVVLAAAMEAYSSKVAQAIGFDLERQFKKENKAKVILPQTTSRKKKANHRKKFFLLRRTAFSSHGGVQFKDIPWRYPGLGSYLEECLGYSFPVLSKIKCRKARLSIAFALEKTFSKDENFNNGGALPLKLRIAAAAIYARVTKDAHLDVAFSRLANRFQVNLAEAFHIADINPLFEYNYDDASNSDDTSTNSSKSGDNTTKKQRTSCYLRLARLLSSPAPLSIPADLYRNLQDRCDPRTIVDLVHVVAIATMLHQLFKAFNDDDLSNTPTILEGDREEEEHKG